MGCYVLEDVLATDCCCNAYQHGLFNATKVCPLVWFPKQKLLSSDKVVITLHCLQYKPPECCQHTSIDLMDDDLHYTLYNCHQQVVRHY